VRADSRGFFLPSGSDGFRQYFMYWWVPAGTFGGEKTDFAAVSGLADMSITKMNGWGANMDKKMTKAEIVQLIIGNEYTDIEDEEVVHILLEQTIAQNSHSDDSVSTFGQKMADKLALFAGSWKFIIMFMVVLIVWIISNIILVSKAFDPYPFILLNLVLSCVAAMQAPVIMMSQNRQEEKDRIRAQNDYKINLKSEVILEDLHAKLDLIIMNQEGIAERINELEKFAK